MSIRSIRGLLALIATGAVVLCGTLVPMEAASAGSPPPPAAAWLASQLNAKGFVPNPGGVGADYGATVQIALALEQAGYTPKRERTSLSYLASHVKKYVVDDSGPKPVDRAAALAVLIRLATVSGAPSFHVNQLIKRLLASQRPSGLFGRTDATYDGTYRQALALEALVAAGVAGEHQAAMAAGVTWLLAQQCTDGGFASLASSPWVGCVSDPDNWLGPDSNSTAEAIVALVVTGQPSGPGTPLARAVANLEATEQVSSSWSYFPGQTPDADSTALAVRALVIAGIDVRSTTGPAAPAGIAPLSALLAFVDPSTGGFRFELDPTYPHADVYSTYEALWALDAVAASTPV